MTDDKLDASAVTPVDLFLMRVYDLFFTTPYSASCFEDDDTYYEEMLCAVKADRFILMTKVRELREMARQGELPL